MGLFVRWSVIGLAVGGAAGALYGLDYALAGAAIGLTGGLASAAVLRVRGR